MWAAYAMRQLLCYIPGLPPSGPRSDPVEAMLCPKLRCKAGKDSGPVLKGWLSWGVCWIEVVLWGKLSCGRHWSPSLLLVRKLHDGRPLGRWAEAGHVSACTHHDEQVASSLHGQPARCCCVSSASGRACQGDSKCPAAGVS